MQPIVIIPARYNSRRFPGKPLVRIKGKPMIQHVWERAKSIPDVCDVIIATDHEEIYTTVQKFGGKAQWTSCKHASGTDRVAAITKDLPDDIIVLNVQGDLPFADPQVCSELVYALRRNPKASIATPVIGHPRFDGDYRNPNVVKSIFDLSFRALFFTRSPVPSVMSTSDMVGPSWYRHIGIYAYRNRALQELTRCSQTVLEKQESLEQLRALEYGYHIQVVPVTNDCGPDINCPEDLEDIEHG